MIHCPTLPHVHKSTDQSINYVCMHIFLQIQLVGYESLTTRYPLAVKELINKSFLLASIPILNKNSSSLSFTAKLREMYRDVLYSPVCRHV